MVLWPVYLSVTFTLGTGYIFDFKLTSTRQNSSYGALVCRSLGYDGLAIISSPEMYNYALQLTEPIRALGSGNGVYIGMYKDPTTNVITWVDGTQPASDSPWTTTLHGNYGNIWWDSGLSFLGGTWKNIALCGNHQNYRTEAHGVTAFGQQPAGVSSSLSVSKARSYLGCVGQCAQNYRCRAAEFNYDLLTCMILGPGSYTGLTANSQSQTFVRNGFD